jgi:pseudouridine kinase
VIAVETEVLDATGAGDALTAGVLFGLLNDFPLDDAMALGVSMASLAMQSSETVRSDLTLEQVYQNLKL